ncbi:MAG: MmgE/PrpD family protein [Desulfatiglandales bacterium]
MLTEGRLVEYVCRTTLGDVPQAVLRVIKNQVLAVLGTTIAGASAEGCEAVVELEKELGGRAEASILIHGGKVPAEKAAFVNGVMARALDFCDALVPGAHIGSATIPAALASAELAGGCSGADFLTAVTVGTELGIRLNLGESQYDGFDPTGVCVPFASTAAAAKILRLSEEETWNALALAFNRCGGSFQANVDGALAVRVIEGWVAETGVTCARLARRGITGPANFLEGVYGYFHLFGRDRVEAQTVTSHLGNDYEVQNVMFKKYPSCGLTQGSTDVILSLMKENGFDSDDVKRIEVTVPPYTYKLVGRPFEVGTNPKVNAQFSIPYCVANALLRKSSRLEHFEESFIRDPRVLELADRVDVLSDPAMEIRGHTPLDMRVLTKAGREHVGKMDTAPGFPGNPLTQKDHVQRFRDCIGFAASALPEKIADRIMDAVEHLETAGDIRDLIPLLVLDSESTH